MPAPHYDYALAYCLPANRADTLESWRAEGWEPVSMVPYPQVIGREDTNRAYLVYTLRKPLTEMGQ